MRATESSQPDHLLDRSRCPADADIRLLEVLVRILQLHPLAHKGAQDALPDLLVLEREAVRIVESAGGGVESLGGLEEAGALGGRVGEGRGPVVVVVVFVGGGAEGVGGVGGARGEEEIPIGSGGESRLAGWGASLGVSLWALPWGGTRVRTTVAFQRFASWR